MDTELTKMGIIPFICTTGVMICGLTVIIAATITVIRGIMATSKAVAQVPQPSPVQKEGRKRRQKMEECQTCGKDLTDVQVIRSEIQDGLTLLVKKCECGRENSFGEATKP